MSCLDTIHSEAKTSRYFVSEEVMYPTDPIKKLPLDNTPKFVVLDYTEHQQNLLDEFASNKLKRKASMFPLTSEQNKDMEILQQKRTKYRSTALPMVSECTDIIEEMKKELAERKKEIFDLNKDNAEMKKEILMLKQKEEMMMRDKEQIEKEVLDLKVSVGVRKITPFFVPLNMTNPEKFGFVRSFFTLNDNEFKQKYLCNVDKAIDVCILIGLEFEKISKATDWEKYEYIYSFLTKILNIESLPEDTGSQSDNKLNESELDD
ncbi:hypothetical protein FDP41_008635 [Naegleria fowleri]|uniref:Uncharacterized protein n=1 Tax=Naegleria fowleri TaxID=5763 RepID=A0A6A5BEP1_NAEFO|nr:uncharacterized protein FDP41_008635 [Naegleria fowleri]KAF0972971.1 hypothetical protein FDP41_008635 [Naegleria fowleri]